MPYNENELNELLSNSPEMLERIYRNAKFNELMHDPEYLRMLFLERKMLEDGISSSLENLRLEMFSDRFNGNDLFESKLKEAFSELAEDILLMPAKTPGKVFQVGKSMYEAFQEDTIKGFNNKIVDALISIPEKTTGFSSLKTIFIETSQGKYELRDEYQKLANAYEDHILSLKSKLQEVNSGIHQQEIPLSDLKALQEKILERHPEFSKLDSQLNDAVNAQKQELENRYKSRDLNFSETSGGASSGNGSNSHSANVFTRIAEQLQSIDAKILQVQSNLQI